MVVITEDTLKAKNDITRVVRMKVFNNLLILSGFIFVTACGGGGGSSSDGTSSEGDSPYLVIASAGSGGVISPVSQKVAEGLTAKLTLTPNNGYSIANVTGCGGTLNGSTYTTGAITENCSVSASFSLDLSFYNYLQVLVELNQGDSGLSGIDLASGTANFDELYKYNGTLDSGSVSY